MKLFQIALLLFNVIPAAKSANKPPPETFDIFWTKSREKQAESQKKDEGTIEKPKYERRANFPLKSDSVDEVTFEDPAQDPITQRKKKALDSAHEVTFEDLAGDLQTQRDGMREIVDSIVGDFNAKIEKEGADDPTDVSLPLGLKARGDFSVTFTGLTVGQLQQMLDLELKDVKGQKVSVNPDRIWAQMRILPDVKTRIRKIDAYFKKQFAEAIGEMKRKAGRSRAATSGTGPSEGEMRRKAGRSRAATSGTNPSEGGRKE